MTVRFFTTFLIVVLCIRCDVEKYTGYNYDAQSFEQGVTIRGSVTNKFTGEGVGNAVLRINNQQTRTDGAGNYEMRYILTEDDNLNRPATITITAENYLPFNTSAIVFPEEEMQLNFELTYGAPIIEAAVLPQLELCQAIVLDYQGIGDIASVVAHFSYVNDAGSIQEEIDVPLQFHGSASNLRAYYQASVSPTMGNLVIFRLFSVTATDRSGFTHTITHLNDPRFPDQPLFPE